MKNDLFNDRISRFSIRKLNVGVCSVLLGTLVMLGTATGVAAEEVVENKQTDEVAVTTEKEQPESLSTSQAEKEDVTTYQATPVVPGATQTGKPKFTAGNSRVPMNDDVVATFDDGSATKTVDGVGTYTVAADGTVTFVPEPSFTGTAPAVTVVREDMNGTKA